MSILEEEEYASFAHIGVFKINYPGYKLKKRESSSTQGTQRFCIYKGLTEDLFGSNTFLHSVEPRANAYILINRKHQNPKAVLEESIDMFSKVFPDIDVLTQ